MIKEEKKKIAFATGSRADYGIVRKYLTFLNKDENVDLLWDSKDNINNTLNYSKEEFIKTFYNIFGKEKVVNSKIVGIKFKIKGFKD